MWGEIMDSFRNKKVLFIISIFIVFLIIIYYYASYKNYSLNVFNHNNIDKTIIIDAGHGGDDGGAIGADGTIEKNVNLQIAEKLRFIMQMYGYNVIMTRNDDNSIHDAEAKTIRQKKVSDIHNREKIIIENPDAIFVSIHQNKYNDSSVHGTQVFYSKNNAQSSVLAQKVQDSVVKSVQKDNFRQIKPSGTEIYLLYHSQIPSIMIECGFISNYNDLKNLKDEKYQKEIAESISDGIINYFIEQDENNGKR